MPRLVKGCHEANWAHAAVAPSSSDDTAGVSVSTELLTRAGRSLIFEQDTSPEGVAMPVIKDYYTIKLHDTDAAGILFFANQFKMAHDIYERFMSQNGFPFRDRFARRDYLIPIVHAEADYRCPVTDGDTVEIELGLERIGNSSFTMKFSIFDLDGRLVGTVRTVHVTMDCQSQTKIPLPDDFRRMLSAYSG
jgi:YbgC/YbaW family acyl-CoA thioester hydrolase